MPQSSRCSIWKLRLWPPHAARKQLCAHSPLGAGVGFFSQASRSRSQLLDALRIAARWLLPLRAGAPPQLPRSGARHPRRRPRSAAAPPPTGQDRPAAPAPCPNRRRAPPKPGAPPNQGRQDSNCGGGAKNKAKLSTTATQPACSPGGLKKMYTNSFGRQLRNPQSRLLISEPLANINPRTHLPWKLRGGRGDGHQGDFSR